MSSQSGGGTRIGDTRTLVRAVWPAARVPDDTCHPAPARIVGGMTRILVTGGAGYVGSVSATAFIAAGHEVVVLDDLTTGPSRGRPGGRRAPVAARTRTRAAIGPAARDRAHRGDPPLRGALAGRRVDPRAGALLPRQRRRRRRAAGGGAGGRRRAHRLLVDRRGLRRPGRRRRSPRTPRSARSTRTARRSGPSRARCAGTAAAYGMRAVSLRYFNVAGATETLGEVHDPETHLIPNVLDRGRGRPELTVFGDDYPTPDGTLHPRLHPRRGPRRRAPAGHRGDGARRPADRRRSSSATWASAAGSRSARSSTRPSGRRAARSPCRRAAPGGRSAGAGGVRRACRRGPRLEAGAAVARRDGRLGLGVAAGATRAATATLRPLRRGGRRAGAVA